MGGEGRGGEANGCGTRGGVLKVAGLESSEVEGGQAAGVAVRVGWCLWVDMGPIHNVQTGASGGTKAREATGSNRKGCYGRRHCLAGFNWEPAAPNNTFCATSGGTPAHLPHRPQAMLSFGRSAYQPAAVYSLMRAGMGDGKDKVGVRIGAGRLCARAQ